MVKDGETIVIAGLISREDSDGNRKMPILGEIPIIGSVFNRNDKSRSDSEILVFITTKIMKEGDSALTTVMQQELGLENYDIGPREGGIIEQQPAKPKKRLLGEDSKSVRHLVREQDSPLSGKELMMEKEVLKVKSNTAVTIN